MHLYIPLRAYLVEPFVHQTLPLQQDRVTKRSWCKDSKIKCQSGSNSMKYLKDEVHLGRAPPYAKHVVKSLKSLKV